MKKKLFSIALCGAVMLQHTAVLHAEEIEVLTPAEESIGTEIPVYGTNDIGTGEEGTVPDGITVDYHSINEINSYYAAHMVNYLDAAYKVTPSTTAPYAAGQLTDDVLNDALNAVNFVRYVAGLNSDVELYTAFGTQTQAGALLNAINNELSTSPARPAGMSDALYNSGYDGNQNSNLAQGFSSPAKAVTDKWVSSADDIATIKERRLILNAKMGKTGFGQVGSYSGMYVSDQSGSCTNTSNVWPAQNMPTMLFSADQPWSISTGNTEDIRNIRIIMQDLNASTETKYEFSASSSDGYFAVDNSDYGGKGAIIWKPNAVTSYNDGDRYDITIYGLSIGRVHYTVKFFDLGIADYIYTSHNDVVMDVGDEVTLAYGIRPASSTDKIISRYLNYSNDVIKFKSATTTQFVIQAKQPGFNSITFTSQNGLTKTVTFTVKGIMLSASSYTGEAGNKYQFHANYYPEDETPALTWTSSNTNVATVSSSGLVTAKNAGTATITVSANGYSATCALTITKPTVTGITVSPSALTVEHNKTGQLTASVTPAGATDVTWSSSNENVATVDSNGVVTGHAAGTATITASAGDYTASATITVPEYIFINSRSAALEDKIQARIYVYVPDAELETTYITTTFNGTSKTEYAKTMETAVRSGRTCRLVTVDTFAKQMRDDIVVKVHEEDGTPKYLEYEGADVTDGYVFHIEDYVKSVEEKATDEKLIDLVRKMNWYGLYAQKQFNYNPVEFEEPAVITNFDDSVLSSYAVQNTGTAEGIEYTSGSLQLDADTGIKVNYTLTGTDTISDYTFKVDGTEVQPKLVSGKRYCVTFKGIPAKKLNEWHTITVTDKAGNTLTTKYSGLTYTYSVVSNASAPDTLKDLCRSIYLYWEAAYNYFPSTSN